MILRSGVLVLGLVALTFVPPLTGCNRRPEVRAPNVESKKFVGNWIENRSGEFGPGFTFGEDAYLRAFDLKDDNTFRFYYVDKDGKQIDTGQAVAGTWAVNGVIVEFKVDTNTLEPDRSTDTPSRITEVSTPETNELLKADVIYAGSVDGMRYYRRLK